MLKLPLLLSLSVASTTTTQAINFACDKAALEDRVKGALIASTIGDALGRVTRSFESTHQVQKLYGEKGLTSLTKLAQGDWIYNASNSKIALYTDNTVLALSTLEVLIEGRKRNHSPDDMSEAFARKLIDIFGPHQHLLDQHYNFRGHNSLNIHAGKRLAGLLETKKDNPWWQESQQDKKPNYFAQESDSGALMRAWPVGLIFPDSIDLVKQLVEEQTLLTHRNPIALAASVALAVGVARAAEGLAAEEVVKQMAEAADDFVTSERRFKPGVKRMYTNFNDAAHLIAQNKMYTGDMIRYAAAMAHSKVTSEKILGTSNKRQENDRSELGCLLGYKADDAVAAVVYIYLRHAHDLKGALIEGANAGGRTALIASLVGALVGASNGFQQLKQQGLNSELDVLENIQGLYTIVGDFTALPEFNHASPQLPSDALEQSIFTNNLLKYGLGGGILGFGAYIAYKLWR